jgi:hypothetical protein
LIFLNPFQAELLSCSPTIYNIFLKKFSSHKDVI